MSNVNTNTNTNADKEAAIALRQRQEAAKYNLGDLLDDIGVVPKTNTELALDRFITGDERMKRIKAIIKQFAPHNTTALLIGETGVGKELLAKALHGERAGKFVAVNCGGIPDTLLETEFFGCVPGAFTGATMRCGYIEEAAQGTLFLDEIGEMPMLLQTKFLRVLQERSFRKVGSNREERVNCRIVAATNNFNVGNKKCFREDLYYRLAGCCLRISPLRERMGDVDLIVARNIVFTNETEALLEKFNQEVLLDDIKSEDGILWPGNVRQLLNRIEAFKVMNNILD